MESKCISKNCLVIVDNKITCWNNLLVVYYISSVLNQSEVSNILITEIILSHDSIKRDTIIKNKQTELINIVHPVTQNLVELLLRIDCQLLTESTKLVHVVQHNDDIVDIIKIHVLDSFKESVHTIFFTDIHTFLKTDNRLVVFLAIGSAHSNKQVLIEFMNIWLVHILQKAISKQTEAVCYDSYALITRLDNLISVASPSLTGE